MNTNVGSNTICIFALVAGGVASYYSKARLRGDTIFYYNDSIVLDLIPVRVGTIGYMYDSVSGTLFGNAGTGDFILGPDIN
jgi:hypothetical protein